jgi:hypothetical protein
VPEEKLEIWMPIFLGIEMAGFFFRGTELGLDPLLLEMKQTRLMNWVIEALGLDFGLVKGKHTPSESKPLVKNLNS